jgi:hypothetical protein
MTVARVSSQATQRASGEWVLMTTGWRPDNTVAWTRTRALQRQSFESSAELVAEIARELTALSVGSY